MIVLSAENLVWALVGLAMGLFLAMAGFALLAELDRRRLRQRLARGRQPDVAPATGSAPAPTRETAPAPAPTREFLAPVPTRETVPAPVAAGPAPVAAAELTPVFVSPQPAGPPLDLSKEAPPDEAALPVAAEAAAPPPSDEPAETAPAETPPSDSPPETPPAAVDVAPQPAPVEEGDKPLPQGIQAAVAEAARRRRAQRARELGLPEPVETQAHDATLPGAAQKRAPDWLIEQRAAASEPPRGNVNVEALFEKAFGESAGIGGNKDDDGR